MSLVTDRVEIVRNALHRAGKDLQPEDWKAVLEEIGADIDGHLEAIKEES